MAALPPEETIAAIATPVGEGSIAVLRVSGPEALSVVASAFRAKSGTPLSEFRTHTVHVGHLLDELGNRIDQVLVTVFRAPHSYTGQDVVEISAHGGMKITRKILDRLMRLGARHAAPGEFTKRAFLNGKMDLTQAEAVLDLIRAKSEKSLELAMRQLSGSLSSELRALKDEMMKVYAHVEAAIDFPDEHLEVESAPELDGKFSALEKRIGNLMAGFKRGSLIREGASVVILGRANTGKSSLFNALLERDRALVSPFPGTTRDPLEEAIEAGGLLVRLTDTAGFSTTVDHPLDRMGMERSLRALEGAQLALYMVDGSRPLAQEDREVFGRLKEAGRFFLTVINKSDLSMQLDEENLRRLVGGDDFLKVSAVTRQGLAALEEKMAAALLERPVESEGEQITRLRHKHALENSSASLRRAREALGRRESLEFVAIDLKAALDGLRELIGEIYSEDLLDVIFSEFCIGK